MKLCTEHYSGAGTAKELDLEVSLTPSYQDKDPATVSKAKEPSFVAEGDTPSEVYLSYPKEDRHCPAHLKLTVLSPHLSVRRPSWLIHA